MTAAPGCSSTARWQGSSTDLSLAREGMRPDSLADVPKSRGRKPARKPARHPRRRVVSIPSDTAGLAWLRLAQVLQWDPADPLQVTALPALFLDAVAAEYGLPPERCLDDCLILTYAYAQLGMAAQVRAARLVITAPGGAHSTHGSLAPQWEDGMIHGHAVVWLPGLAHLVDVTAGQYPLIAAAGQGPVIASCTPVPGKAAGEDDAVLEVRVPWDDLHLAYTLAPLATTAAMLASPQMRDPGRGHGHRGMNVASETVRMLASELPPGQVRLIPHPRAAALAQAVRDLPGYQDEAGDWRFVLPGPADGLVPHAVELAGIPLSAGTPPPAEPGLQWRGG